LWFSGWDDVEQERKFAVRKSSKGGRIIFQDDRFGGQRRVTTP